MSAARAPAAPRVHGRSGRVARATTITSKAVPSTCNSDDVDDVQQQQQRRLPFFVTLRRSATAAAAAAVLVAAAPGPAYANQGVPLPPNNGILRNLPRGVYQRLSVKTKKRDPKISKDLFISVMAPGKQARGSRKTRATPFPPDSLQERPSLKKTIRDRPSLVSDWT